MTTTSTGYQWVPVGTSGYQWVPMGTSVPGTSAPLCVFEKRGPKMSNFQLLFLHGFSSKNCEILNKAVLTPQEYNDFF